MRICPTVNLTLPMLCITAILVASGAGAAESPSTEQAKVKQLQEQVDALNRELAKLENSNSPTTQQRLMQQHWSMMQDHMRTMRMMPGMAPRRDMDWMMMDPYMMGPGMKDHGMMGPGMMGHGLMDWGTPASMAPDAYRRQMQDHFRRMQKQMAAISAERDPVKRQTLIREHYDAMYRHMQSMRGMGWMWAPSAAVSLPEATSPGAQLVAKYCSQCHAAPSPSVHTAQEWSLVTSRMRAHIDDQINGAGPTVKVPTASELNSIEEYLGRHAAGVR